MFASNAFYNFGFVQKLLVLPEIFEPKLRESNTNKRQFFNNFFLILNNCVCVGNLSLCYFFKTSAIIIIFFVNKFLLQSHSFFNAAYPLLTVYTTEVIFELITLILQDKKLQKNRYKYKK